MMMIADKPLHEIELVMQSMVAQTQDYFETEHETCMIDVDSGAGRLDTQPLLDMTAIIGLGGLVNLQAVFSFQSSLVNAVYESMTEGFHVPPEQVEKQREAAIGELVNTVLGHCTLDLQHLDRQGIALTPPVILDRAKVLTDANSAVIARHCLHSSFGRMTISLVDPTQVFSARPDSRR